MSKDNGFYFIPKKWLGDADIIAMDWDCKGMHLHLMAIAWQQEPKGYLLDDEKLIKKLLGNPPEEDWEYRIKPQILRCWKTTIINDGNTERKYIYQPGIIETAQKKLTAEPTTRKPRKQKKSELLEFENPEFIGFNLENILKAKPTATILHEKSNEEDKHNIWTIGVQLVRKQDETEAKARGFLARLIKDYGDKAVAEAIAQLSLKSVPPVEVHSYLVGILKKQQEPEKKRTGRGSVSL